VRGGWYLASGAAVGARTAGAAVAGGQGKLEDPGWELETPPGTFSTHGRDH